MTAVNPIPDGYPRAIPYLAIDGAADAIEFYTSVLGFTERMRMPAPDNKIGHAELELGNAVVMLADEFPEMGALSPKTVGGTPVTIMVYVQDIDAVHAAALAAGATSTREPENQFYGDRAGEFVDPWGHKWHIASHVEDVTPEEMSRRMAEMMP